MPDGMALSRHLSVGSLKISSNQSEIVHKGCLSTKTFTFTFTFTYSIVMNRSDATCVLATNSLHSSRFSAFLKVCVVLSLRD